MCYEKGTKVELTAAREALQADLEEALDRDRTLEDALRRHEEREQAQFAMIENLKQRCDVAEKQCALLREGAAHWEAVCRAKDEDIAQIHDVQAEYRRGITQEILALCACLERALHANQMYPQQPSDITEAELALAGLISQDPEDSPAQSNRRGTGGTNLTKVKDAFTPMYEFAKDLRKHFMNARSEKKRLEEALGIMKSQVSQSDADLQSAIQDTTATASKLVQCEAQLSRALSDLERINDAMRGECTAHERSLQHLAATLGVFADWAAVEAQAQVTCDELARAKQRCEALQRTVFEQREELNAQKQLYEDRLAIESERARREIDQNAAALRQQLLNTADQRSRELASAVSERESTSAAMLTLQVEREQLAKKYDDALNYIKELEPHNRQLTREVNQLRGQLSAAARESELLLSIQDRTSKILGREFDASFQRRGVDMSPSRRAGEQQMSADRECSVFELLIIALRVLAGARRDIAEMGDQRRCLTRSILEYERTFGPLLLQFAPTRSMRMLLKFRTGCVAVLAVNRLLKFLKGKVFREVVSSTRKGFARVRLLPTVRVFVAGGALQPTTGDVGARILMQQDFILPNRYEIQDLPSFMAILLDQLRCDNREGTPLRSRNRPLLAHHLREGLHRILLNYRRRSDCPASPPVLPHPLYPSLVVPSLPIERHRRDLGPQQTIVHTAPSNTVTSRNLSPPRKHAGGASANPTPPTPGDEFTIEVLNAIRALDNRVTGALHRHR